jgi:hypothetical protein
LPPETTAIDGFPTNPNEKGMAKFFLLLASLDARLLQDVVRGQALPTSHWVDAGVVSIDG